MEYTGLLGTVAAYLSLHVTDNISPECSRTCSIVYSLSRYIIPEAEECRWVGVSRQACWIGS